MLVGLIGSLRDLPAQPSTFLELKAALASPSSNLDDITKIVERDVALCAKLLQLVNSAFFGLSRTITDVKTAVGCVGLAVLQDLVITLELFRAFVPNEFVTEEFHAHSQRVANIAATLAREYDIPQPVVVAALLHDVGKLVIAERTPAHFSRSIAQAAAENSPLFVIEEKLIHISHAEVGAYLLSLWGLPQEIVPGGRSSSSSATPSPRETGYGPSRLLANLLAHEKEALEPHRSSRLRHGSAGRSRGGRQTGRLAQNGSHHLNSPKNCPLPDERRAAVGRRLFNCFIHLCFFPFFA